MFSPPRPLFFEFIPRATPAAHRSLYSLVALEKKKWQRERDTTWANADAICIPIPKFLEDDEDKCKTTAVSTYLLGYAFNATVMVLTRNEVHFLATEKKRALLEKLSAVKGPVKLVLHRFVLRVHCL